ncbi:MAG: 50S ribosomal protein L29 [Crocinitomicaceae bacterium]|jgi:large subunit ribosomal protein L29|nr:50S ribosomal protein L29 [Crocinitomicaceae bacterium]
MKQEEINKLSLEDLKIRITSTEDQLLKMKISHSVTPMENPMQIRAIRKSIARMKTELGKRVTQAQTA